jgi:hypothetical protein
MARTRSKPEPANLNWDSESNLLTWLATCVSVLSFLFYYRNGEVLLYGDAIAHINIARRVFDSRTPGLLQLGTVWLPVPHLLIIPFILSKRMWQSGAGGSIPSMASYVFGVLGIFRLVRRALARTDQIEAPARLAAWTAAIIYAANPNLIYMQATAMGESLYLAFFIWAVVYFSESLWGDRRALTKAGLCLAAACLTRYDGWFLAGAMAAAVIVLALWPAPREESKFTRPTKAAALKFVLLIAAAPSLWLAYNGIVYRNPLEFENGPYSAKAIERRTQSTGNPGHPGTGNPFVAGLFLVKSAEDNIAQSEWLQRTWILLVCAASVGAVVIRSRKSVSTALLLLFLIPIPFYALSIAYGGVPIFIPQWWPFTHYNARYGLQLLPLFSIALALLVYFIAQIDEWPSRVRLACTVAILAIVAASYLSVWRAVPICLEEARANMRTRTEFQKQLATLLEKLPADSTLLMYTGDHVGALERAGIPLKRTINEGNHRVWKQPSDVDGLWERALADPSKYADYVLAFEGDPVWQAVHDDHLRELVEIHVTGQAPATLYRAR